jgi:DUF1680 family protein
MLKNAFAILGSLIACAPAVFAGDLTDRYQLTLERVLKGGPPVYTETFVLQDVIPEHVRRFTEYSGDVSGRYVGALASAAADLDRGFLPLDQIVPKILALQKPDGFFGDAFHFDAPQPNDMALLWGNGRLLIGLLEYYRYKPQPETLASAKKVAEFLLRIAPLMNSEETRSRFETGQFASGYICWTQNIEAFAELYRLTRDERYREAAERIVERTERKPSEHAHGYLTSLRGIVELHKATGEQRYLERAENEWQAIVDSDNVTLAGGIPEAWQPKALRTEGCGDADWVRLSLALWQLTGKSKYLEMAERSVFNELAMNQFLTGDFGNRVFAPTGVAQRNASRAWWCCTLHGLRCLPDVAEAAFRNDRSLTVAAPKREAAGTLYYDLPVDGRGRAGDLRMTAESHLGSDGTVALTVVAAGPGEQAVEIRRPEWARTIAVRVGGSKQETVERGAAFRTARRWKKGDRLTVRYEMRTRAVRKPKSERIALFHGPWLLGIDEAASPAYYEELRSQNRLAVELGPGDEAVLTRAGAPRPGRFAVPAAQFEVSYLPGGYPQQPVKALLRPIAEQTGFLSAEWEFWFALAAKQ